MKAELSENAGVHCQLQYIGKHDSHPLTAFAREHGEKKGLEFISRFVSLCVLCERSLLSLRS